MVYNWDGKEAECYRLYIEERKNLDDIVEIWRKKGFCPSKRAFQVQFKRWQFPSKQNPAHKNAALVARVKELWERNTSQKEMLVLLNNEGFKIKERELMRVRARNRWLLRVPNGMKSVSVSKKDESGSGDKGEDREERTIMDQLAEAVMEGDAEADSAGEENAAEETTQHGPASEKGPEVLRKRQERLEKLQAESDERWRTRKRRRRTRGWAGMPADPSGPPRFPSETTIDESKAYLSLDNDLYRQVRDHFQAICEEEGVLKKTIAGPDKWAEVKDRLVRENAHLQNIFWGDGTQSLQDGQAAKNDQKVLSLDVICTDVTKRMRTLERRMTIAEAKNSLEINPEESRQIRHAFYAKLQAHQFFSKLEAGDEHWNELKKQWVEESDMLQRILAPGAADANHELKKRAVEVLARDVMKRLRDDQTRKDPSKKKQVNTGPGPGPAKPSMNAHVIAKTYSASATRTSSELVKRAGRPKICTQTQTQNKTQNQTEVQYQPHSQTRNQNQNENQNQTTSLSLPQSLQIDPSLLLAAADPSLTHDENNTSYTSDFTSHPYPSHPHTHSIPLTTPIPIYFRLNPHSTTPLPSKHIWLSALHFATVAEIRTLAMREHPGTLVVKIEGLIVLRGQGGVQREMLYAIDDEVELGGYLAHVGQGGKVTFVVLLAIGHG
ncbi:hypothetical protein K432DRAFT_378201 [Lepidopterella palustris CBS 459.81]|uniref:Clr5 domain-containing protein n=1 Tax=Lepidopterella palustris CBS 459.81 TaxID=1314670 RepID=A0A8E2EIW7_9PEZI|nr:hypothetical protein K432DRAFT_378201 [Lepidopterella palustris CBS 459.81]